MLRQQHGWGIVLPQVHPSLLKDFTSESRKSKNLVVIISEPPLPVRDAQSHSCQDGKLVWKASLEDGSLNRVPCLRKFHVSLGINHFIAFKLD